MIKPVESATRPGKNGGAATIETVADILDREVQVIIQEWLTRVEKESGLMSIKMNRQDRTGHLPHLLHDVIRRLRMEAGTKGPISTVAAEHGDLRYKQGYIAAMTVE